MRARMRPALHGRDSRCCTIAAGLFANDDAMATRPGVTVIRITMKRRINHYLAATNRKPPVARHCTQAVLKLQLELARQVTSPGSPDKGKPWVTVGRKATGRRLGCWRRWLGCRRKADASQHRFPQNRQVADRCHAIATSAVHRAPTVTSPHGALNG